MGRPTHCRFLSEPENVPHDRPPLPDADIIFDVTLNRCAPTGPMGLFEEEE